MVQCTHSVDHVICPTVACLPGCGGTVVIRLVKVPEFGDKGGAQGARARDRGVGQLLRHERLVSMKLDGGHVGLQG